MLDNVADGVYSVDLDRTITYWNRGAERITGYRTTEVVGRRCFANILAHVDGTGNQLCRNECPLAATIQDGETRHAELWLRHRDGHRQPVRIRTAAIHDEAGTIVGAVEVFDDAADLQAARADVSRARHDSLTDPLTQLANRRAFDEDLRIRLERLQRYGWPFAVVLADLDRFKVVNDRHGHAAGDAALRVAASTLAGGARIGDLVSRWGGDEFALLVDGEDATVVAERLRALIGASSALFGGHKVRVTLSIGVAQSVADESTDALLGRADAALYAAKAAGRNKVSVAPRPEGGAA